MPEWCPLPALFVKIHAGLFGLSADAQAFAAVIGALPAGQRRLECGDAGGIICILVTLETRLWVDEDCSWATCMAVDALQQSHGRRFASCQLIFKLGKMPAGPGHELLASSVEPNLLDQCEVRSLDVEY